MLIIAHRGNLNGPNPLRENTEQYIIEALDAGFHVEVDVWYSNNKLYLGHEAPQYKTSIWFLTNHTAIIAHAKTVKTLAMLMSIGVHCFYHDTDAATITSQGIPWLYPSSDTISTAVTVMPERISVNWINEIHRNFPRGVCTDYPQMLLDSYTHKFLR